MSTPEIVEYECTHEDIDYEPGNYVSPFGWEQWPGWFCEDCGEEVEAPEPDPDARWDARWEE